MQLTLLSLLSLLVVLGVLIFVHELGHFLVAKAVGIQVLRFSLGFGRPLVEWKRGETEYWISWIPLGGYVKMSGLEEEGMVGELEGGKAAVAIDPARTFDSKPLWARMAVILAGVTMNILLAFFLFAGLFAVDGEPVPAATQVDTVLTHMVPPGTEGLTALRRGDRIVRVNGDTIKSWVDLQNKLFNSDSAARLEIQGRPEPLVVRLPQDQTLRARALSSIRPYGPPRIGMVYPGEPAARGGLKPGDEVIRIDRDTVRSWNDVQLTLWRSPGKALVFTVRRDTALVDLTITPRSETETDSTSPRPHTFGFIAAEGDVPVIKQPLPLGRALAAGAMQTVIQGELVIRAVGRLVRGKGLRELGGPITIAQVSGQAARLGLDRFLSVLAIISVGLAILNLLPIPVLDGGHAMFLIIEAIRRKPLSPQLRLRLTQVGMLIVFAIMIIAISNDVLRNIR